MANADIIAALRGFLLADADVAALVGTGIYGGAMPRAAVAGMAQPALVLTLSGGVSIAQGSWMRGHDTQRVDVTAWGATEATAYALANAARHALTGIRRLLVDGVLIHWAEPAGGALDGRDPDGRWINVWRPYQVFHATQEAA